MTTKLRFEILSRDVFSCFAGFLWTHLVCSGTETRKTLSDKVEGMDFYTCGKTSGTLGKRELLCVNRPRTENASIILALKTLREWIHCLYTNMIFGLFVVINQSIFDCRKQTLRLDTSQPVLIWDPTVH